MQLCILASFVCFFEGLYEDYVVLITLLFAQNIYAAIVEKVFIKVNAILIMKTENICMRTVLDVLAQTK